MSARVALVRRCFVAAPPPVVEALRFGGIIARGVGIGCEYGYDEGRSNAVRELGGEGNSGERSGGEWRGGYW